MNSSFGQALLGVQREIRQGSGFVISSMTWSLEMFLEDIGAIEDI
jgi:hypothetical protein